MSAGGEVVVAVVIPAWDLGEELEEAVRSVTEQDVPARVIVVENATERPLPELEAVEILHLPERLTVGAARNAGLAAVTEELVMFMEGDDVLLPGGLRFLRDQLLSRPQACAVAGAFVVWNPHTGQRAQPVWPFAYCYRLNRWPRAFALWNCVRNVFPTTGPVLVRTSAARAAGGFADSDWAEDWAFGAVLCFAGVPLLERRTCGLYRVDPDRVTLSDRKELRFRPAWRGRRSVRRKLARSALVPLPVRVASPLLALPHLYFTLRELRQPRQRVQ